MDILTISILMGIGWNGININENWVWFDIDIYDNWM